MNNNNIFTKAAAIVLGIFMYLYPQAGNAQYIISTVAGNGIPDFGGLCCNGYPALPARLGRCYSVVADRLGNIYFNDEEITVRKVDTHGILTIYAGDSTGGFNGDGGPATAAGIWASCIAMDTTGNMYICDAPYRVRRVDAVTGVISTVAGNGIRGHGGDGGSATAAELESGNIAVDQAGNLYISDSIAIRRVDAATGIITKIAGNGTAGFSGDGGPATAASVNSVEGMAVSSSGDLFFGDYDSYRIRVISPSGIIRTYAGTGTSGFGGDGGQATVAEIGRTSCLMVDSMGALYICDYSNNRIRTVNGAGIITTLVGGDTLGYRGDGGPATAAQIHTPEGVARYGNGNIYFNDYVNNRVRMLSTKPFFSHGAYQAAAGCSGAPVSLDTLLAINNANGHVTEHWSLVAGPHHGTAAVAYSAVTTGGTVYPAGLSYTPAVGYTGFDTLSVCITDSIISDTTTIYIGVTGMAPAGNITGADTVCVGDTITLADTAAGGIWGAMNGNAATWGNKIAGTNAGTDTITYAVTNGCGTATATHLVAIKACINAVPVAKEKPLIELHPNPNTGTFTMSVTSTTGAEARVVITNMLGIRIKELTIPTNKPVDLKLDVPAGVYILSATTAGGKWEARLVVDTN